MPAVSKISSISSPINRDTLAAALITAFSNAGYSAIHDDFTNASGVRSLVYRQQFNANTHGTIFLENQITQTRIISSRITTSWNLTTHTPGAIATALSSSVSFGALARVNFTAINHPELRLVLMEQGTTAAQILGIVRPAIAPPWWSEATYPYAFIPQNVNLNTFLPFPSANNPYASTANYPLLYISQLAANAPISNLPDAIAGAALILSPTNKGVSGAFSNEVALCSGTGLKRGDMLGEFLLLYPATSGIAVRSNIPA